jgi:branched-chain amino acid transport system permease protein
MVFFGQLVISGLSLGMIYALVTLGFVLILKSTGEVFNIAQGQFVLIGGYLAYTFMITAHLPIWVSLLLAIAIAAVMGMLVERFAMRPLLGQEPVSMVMMTIALGAFLDGVVTVIWGGQYETYHEVMPAISIRLGELSVSSESLIGIIVSIVAVTILLLLLRFTKIGLAVRATAEDLRVVRVFGIKVTSVFSLSWIIAAITAVIAGVILGGISGVSIPMAEIGLKALVVALLGGVNSIEGAVVAGIILGILENIAAGYIDPLLPGGGVAQIFPFIVMIFVLVIKPNGLFGKTIVERI